MSIYDIIGIAGAGIILVAFLLNQVEKLDSDSFSYDLLNTIGSLLLVVYGVHFETWPFVVLNVVWAVMSGKDVIKYLINNKQ